MGNLITKKKMQRIADDLAENWADDETLLDETYRRIAQAQFELDQKRFKYAIKEEKK